ncbi:MAG: heme ABC exporter ATP-binding protein CcmA [Panacagrimonas sp.]
MSTLLTATALSVGRGDRRLLSDLDLSVSAGDVLHLRGPNGVGKSSLIEVLAGLRPALKGQLQRTQPMHWIGHRNALQGDLSVVENLAYWCAINEVGIGGLPTAMDRLGLSRLKSRPARTLSAGQKRRVALARLLTAPRPLWLLDEPLSGLDAAGVVLLGQLMNEHVATGQGAILVTSHQPLPGRLPRVTVVELA